MWCKPNLRSNLIFFLNILKNQIVVLCVRLCLFVIPLIECSMFSETKANLCKTDLLFFKTTPRLVIAVGLLYPVLINFKISQNVFSQISYWFVKLFFTPVHDWSSYSIICWTCRVEGTSSLEAHVGDVVGLWGTSTTWSKGLMHY